MMLALLFPGQGSQFVGMGKSLFESSPAARAVFEEADAALGFSLSRLCFEGPEEELQLTANTQPAILTHSIAALRDLEARFPERLEGAAFAAGHSLGEYSADVAAGAARVRRRGPLVRRRGEFMQEAVPAGVGAMAADPRARARSGRRGLPRGGAGRGRRARPTSTRPSRPSSPATRRRSRARARSARRAARSGSFRCRSPPRFTARSWRRRGNGWRRCSRRRRSPTRAFPVVTNVDASAVSSGAGLRDALVRQIDSPVRWVESVAPWRPPRRGPRSRDRAGQRARGPGAPDREGPQGRDAWVRRGCARRGRAVSAPLLALAVGCAASAPSPGVSPIDAAVAAASARCGCRMGIAAKHLESGRAYEHLARRVLRGRVGHQDRGPDRGDGGRARGARGPLRRVDAFRVREGRRLGPAPDARRRAHADLERPVDAHDRAVGQHRDQRLDPRGSARTRSTRGWRRSGSPTSACSPRSPPTRPARRSPLPGRDCNSASLAPREVALWYERVAKGELLDADSSRPNLRATSTRTRAPAGGAAILLRRTSGPERPAR